MQALQCTPFSGDFSRICTTHDKAVAVSLAHTGERCAVLQARVRLARPQAACNDDIAIKPGLLNLSTCSHTRVPRVFLST